MYRLPLSTSNQSYFPLHEHSGFVLGMGLLHDDLDDRLDTFLGALEVDPLLAAWSACTADRRSQLRLTSRQAAARWLSQAGQDVLATTLSGTTTPFPVKQRCLWREIAQTAVTAARRAQAILQEDHPRQTQSAYWLAMLGSVKAACDGIAQLNGQSPFPGLMIRWPDWLDAELTRVSLPEVTAVCRALEEQSAGALPTLVAAEERELWFRPYPEFHNLLPLLVNKLTRLRALEEDFAEVLQAEKLASLQQLAYGASHEINNPLANISTRAQTLMHNESDPERRRKLLAINEQAFRAYEMIADLMLFAKPPRLEWADVEVAALLEDVRDELEDFARQRESRMEIPQVHPRELAVRGDANQLAIAIAAICKNGIEAMPQGGVLTTSATLCTDSGQARIRIEDQGSGMGDVIRRHLFDPFFSGREAGRGLGFGLSKAWRIVEQHHGRIEVSSQHARGSCFIVSLPCPSADHNGASRPLRAETI